MSVQYYLNKDITLGDLKKADFNIERNESGEGHPYVVSSKNYNSAVAISEFEKGDVKNEDGLVIKEFEGRFSHGGGVVMLEMCDKFDCKFITDEDIERALYTESNEITEEAYDARTKNFREYFTRP